MLQSGYESNFLFLLISLEWLYNILKDCILYKLKLTSFFFLWRDFVCLIFPVMAASQFEGFV